MPRTMLGALGVSQVAPIYLHSLVGAIRGVKRVVELRTKGYISPVFLRTPSSDPRVYRKVFVEKEYDFDVREQPKVIVDAGANIGLASVYFAHKYPGATVIAIEPEKDNFELLKVNVSPYPNVIPLRAALWNENGHVFVNNEGRGEWGFVTSAESAASSPADQSSDTVSAITLDSLIHSYGLSRVDILKIDIEGAEKEVFDDTSLWIGQVESIIIELHERIKLGCNRSFYCGSPGFDDEWAQGENIYLAKRAFLRRSQVL